VSEWPAAKTQLDAILGGVDLDLSPDEEAQLDIANLAEERARSNGR
jgi:hypothetical protein